MTTAFYFHNLKGLGGPESSYFLKHPIADVKFLFVLLGDVVGAPTTAPKDIPEIALFGAVIFALAVAVLVIYGRRRDKRDGSPVGMSLICFGLLFAASTAYGRILFGSNGAGASRYTTYDLLVLVGIYMMLLDRPRQPATNGQSFVSIGTGAVAALRFVAGVVIVIQVLVGTHNALPRTRYDYAYQMQELQISRNIDHSQRGQIERLAFFYPVPYLLAQIHTAEQLHLRAFADR